MGRITPRKFVLVQFPHFGSYVLTHFQRARKFPQFFREALRVSPAVIYIGKLVTSIGKVGFEKGKSYE